MSEDDRCFEIEKLYVLTTRWKILPMIRAFSKPMGEV